MDNVIFDRSRINTGRQFEIDLLKAFSIIMMIITHCVDDLYINYEEHFISVVIDDVLAQTVGAAGFMICMGVGIVYSKEASPKDYLRRGLSLLIIGQILNLLRYAVPGIISYLISGEEIARDYCMLTFSSDILQFAGLFFVVMGLFKRLELKPWVIFIISAILNIGASLLTLKIHTGNYVLDQFIGLFVCTETESYFPLFHWMIYPAFGMILGVILMHVKDKKKFYGLLLVPTMIIWAVYYYIGICVDQNIIKFYNEWKSISYVNIADALLQLICNFSMLCMFYFLSLIISENMKKSIAFVSRNINRYYCVHMFIINGLYAIIPVFCDESPINSAAKCYLCALAIIILCTVIIWYYDLKIYAPLHEFLGRHLYIWYAFVIALTIAACVFASMGEDNYLNLFNDYLDWL